MASNTKRKKRKEKSCEIFSSIPIIKLENALTIFINENWYISVFVVKFFIMIRDDENQLYNRIFSTIVRVTPWS